MTNLNLDGYIKVRTALNAIQNSTHPNCDQHINDSWESHVLGVIANVPTEDVVPVRHGHWIKKQYWSEGVGMGESYGYWYACSECGHKVKGDYGSCDDMFCSECGTRMDGKAY